MTSHLESTKDCFRERQRQLEMVLEKMKEQDPNSMVLFAGDMNLRDKELNGIGGLDSRGILDVWEKVGNDASKFTWDVSANDNLDWPHSYKPKLRFDRVFVRPGGGVEPVSFSLVGTKRVPSCGRFPNDHWGIWCEFAITNM
ncbi:predicted protein [Nematostella vectensis]|uniref:Tyrosyl-DNA phosphodiesterase 2 n=1 Tax=Nematostella vectensis TaxID=45351 RepID=A7SCH2_NEMVE|nr:predicted protein [Nematostella vectensis]|eukprot:XP_001630641.1 predicted protein [Nematostella vectensis]